MQWGTIGVAYMSKSTKFIYPLTVQSVLYANYKSTTNGTWQTNYNNYLWNVTNESMNVTNTDNTGTVNVVALVIGIAQQWGYIQQPNGTPESTYPLPTNFTTLYMTGCCANRGAWYKDTVGFSATLTTITISTATGNVAVGYILLGMQQWGSNLNSLTLPIAFSTECFNFQCWQYDITEYRYSGIVPSIACSNTAISGWNGQYSLRYLVIGEQQWGSPYVAGENEFLLAFSEFVVMAASSEYSYTADNMVQFVYLNYFYCNASTLNSHRGWIALGI